MTPLRLYVTAPLSAGAELAATPAQAHYLTTVMRRTAGDTVVLFNGQDGEWSGRIVGAARGKAALLAETQLRPQHPEPDLWLLFALLKRDTTDLVVQKATELGVSVIIPLLTERTNAGRINADRLLAIAMEAAEQSERLTIPTIQPLRALDQALADWPHERPLFVALERDQAASPPQSDGPAALLIGPEGGFGPRERTMLQRHKFVRPMSLGPRILRAETAAIAGLALLLRPGC